eukprot:12856249-Alexandrium_andersonii.AAC.1
MSASLVGSEMCIRDRYYDGLRRTATYCHVLRHAKTYYDVLRPTTTYYDCLLYTSDAADDM